MLHVWRYLCIYTLALTSCLAANSAEFDYSGPLAGLPGNFSVTLHGEARYAGVSPTTPDRFILSVTGSGSFVVDGSASPACWSYVTVFNTDTGQAWAGREFSATANNLTFSVEVPWGNYEVALSYQNVGSIPTQRKSISVLAAPPPPKDVRVPITNPDELNPLKVRITWPDGTVTFGELAPGETYMLTTQLQEGQTVSVDAVYPDYDVDPITGKAEFREGALGSMNLYTHINSSSAPNNPPVTPPVLTYSAPPYGSRGNVTEFRDSEGNITGTSRNNGITSDQMANLIKNQTIALRTGEKEIVNAIDAFKAEFVEFAGKKISESEMTGLAGVAAETFVSAVQSRVSHDAESFRADYSAQATGQLSVPVMDQSSSTGADTGGISFLLPDGSVWSLPSDPADWMVGNIAIRTIAQWVKAFIAYFLLVNLILWIQLQIKTAMIDLMKIPGNSATLGKTASETSATGFSIGVLLGPVANTAGLMVFVSVLATLPVIILSAYTGELSIPGIYNQVMSLGSVVDSGSGAIWNVATFVVPINTGISCLVYRVLFTTTTIPIQYLVHLTMRLMATM